MTTRTRRVIRVPIRPGSQRAIGIGLIAWGILGIGLVAAALLLLAGRVPAAGGIETREDLARTMEASRLTLREAAVAVRGADVGLTGAALAAGSAGRMMDEMGTSLSQLSTALRLTILGTQPFAGPADDFARLADRTAQVAMDLETVRASVSIAAEDTSRLADSIDRLEVQIGDLQESIDLVAGDGLGHARLLLAVLLGWMAMLALVSLWIGVRWVAPARRPPPRS
jgi:hypothetical protein